MTSVVPRFQTGPRTYTVAETVDGGQLVEARTGGLVGVAAAASATVLGVALKPAALPATHTSGTPLDVATAVGSPVTVPVASGPCSVPVKYAATVAFGARLAAGATGQVTTASTNPVIGYCDEPGGVTSGNVGLVKLLV
jgi:hypothetical protein